jgi:hypothetical protein
MASPLSDRNPASPLTNRWLQLAAVFAIAIGMNVVAAVLGIGVLRPLRAARMKSVAIAE